MSRPSASTSLAGRRIVVTRPRADDRLRRLLAAEGAEIVEFPTIRIAPPPDYEPLDAALARLAEYAWVVFTSRNGVTAVVDRLAALGHRAAVLGRARLAAIGPGTGEALRRHGLTVDVSPAEFRAEALLAALARGGLRGTRVLIPRAAVARDVLPDGLRRAGAVVDVVAAYRTDVEHRQVPEAAAAVRGGRIDAITFTSSSTVRHFVRLVGPGAARALDGVLVACIGPVTAETARAAGLRVGIVAHHYTLAGLVDALRTGLGRRRPAAKGRRA